MFDATTDPALVCRVPVADDHPFPIQNLPFGAFARAEEARAHIGIAIGDFVLDLRELARFGAFDDILADALDVFADARLNAFLQRGRPAWRGVRERVSQILSAAHSSSEDDDARDAFARALVPMRDVRLELPIDVADYVDFYASRYHAENAGRIFRPAGEPLFANWRWMPVGYHGRASGVVIDGTPIVRPCGQIVRAAGTAPVFAPSAMLDFELELGFISGDGPPLGTAMPVARARETIFGAVLLNDWSARDVQAWENQPLGPFLSKAFATSISPWIVTADALEPFACASADPNDGPLPHLRDRDRNAYDIALEVDLDVAASDGTRERRTIVRTNAKYLYWSPAQQIAHLSSCGARVRAGDLFGTGTISGPSDDARASLLEITLRGTRPLTVGERAERTFLADGDLVEMRGRCERAGARTIGLGRVCGTIGAAHSNASASEPVGVNPSS